MINQVMGEVEEFKKQTKWVIGHYQNFDINKNVSVFETNIRVVGGLISSHLFAEDLFPPV